MIVALLNPPFSTAVVDVPDESVEKYEAQGWVAVKAPTKPDAEPEKRRPTRRS